MLFVSNLQEQERSRQYQKQLEDIKSQINKSGNKSAVCVNLSCRDKADPIQCIYLFVYVYFCVNTNNIFVYYFWLQIKLLDKIIQKEIKSQPNGLIQKARYIYIYMRWSVYVHWRLGDYFGWYIELRMKRSWVEHGKYAAFYCELGSVTIHYYSPTQHTCPHSVK